MDHIHGSDHSGAQSGVEIPKSSGGVVGTILEHVVQGLPCSGCHLCRLRLLRCFAGVGLAAERNP